MTMTTMHGDDGSEYDDDDNDGDNDNHDIYGNINDFYTTSQTAGSSSAHSSDCGLAVYSS